MKRPLEKNRPNPFCEGSTGCKEIPKTVCFCPKKTFFECEFLKILLNYPVLLQHVEFHYTPKHASWLNVAEIEINVIDMEYTGRRFEDFRSLEDEVSAWTGKRNRDRKKIKWKFDRAKADKKLSKYYTE